MADRTADPGPIESMLAIQAATEGQRLCALGQHSWLPWVPTLTLDDGRVLQYETYCFRCRQPEVFDL